jgi:hypothetical protein
MKPIQFPTYAVMLAVLLVAIWLVAVRHPNALTTSAVFTTTIAVLGMASLLAVAHRDDRRFFWRGFIVAGWLYFIFAFGPMIMKGDAPYFLPEVLVHDVWLYAQSGSTYFTQNLSAPTTLERPAFVKNAHALLTLLLALGGGFIARFVALRDERP